MILEKELKILEIDKQKIIKTLEELGAKKHFEGFIHDIYYDFPGAKMQENKRIFRVRKKGEDHIYTIKRKRTGNDIGAEKGLKVADEHETKITDVESFSAVLEKYGLEKTREKKKHRISYSLDNVEFDIDDYENIPTLLEIESTSLDEINAWIKKLGLRENITKDFGSRGLFEYYGLEYLNF